MTNYQAPWEQKWAADQAVLVQRVAALERQVAQLTSGQVSVTSTTHPASPWAGMQIYETDTALTAYWSGTAWVYPPQVLWSRTLGATTASVTTPALPAVFNFLRLDWRVHLTTGGPTDLLMQVDSDTTAHYLWAKDEAVSGASTAVHGGSAQNFMKVGAVGGSTGNYYATGSLSIAGWHGGTAHLAVSGTSTLFDTNSVDYVGTYGGLFAAPPPHTSLTVFPAANSFVAGSQFLLVGLG